MNNCVQSAIQTCRFESGLWSNVLLLFVECQCGMSFVRWKLLVVQIRICRKHAHIDTHCLSPPSPLPPLTNELCANFVVRHIFESINRKNERKNKSAEKREFRPHKCTINHGIWIGRLIMDANAKCSERKILCVSWFITSDAWNVFLFAPSIRPGKLARSYGCIHRDGIFSFSFPHFLAFYRCQIDLFYPHNASPSLSAPPVCI